MKRQNLTDIEMMPTVAKPSEKEMWERGLRILARIIARLQIENACSEDAPEEGGPLREVMNNADRSPA